MTALDILWADTLPRLEVSTHKRRKLAIAWFKGGVSKWEIAQIFGVEEQTIRNDVRGAV